MQLIVVPPSLQNMQQMLHPHFCIGYGSKIRDFYYMIQNGLDRKPAIELIPVLRAMLTVSDDGIQGNEKVVGERCAHLSEHRVDETVEMMYLGGRETNKHESKRTENTQEHSTKENAS